MKNFTLLIVLFLFFSITSFAQEFAWAKSFGGNNNELGSYLAVDKYGNVYSTGKFEGTVDFDPSANVYNLSSSGSYDIFITKLDPLGNLIWAKKVGGSSTDMGESIFIDPYGDLLITGAFNGTVDFDPNSGTYNLLSNGNEDIFILKIKSNGNYVWAKNMGGLSFDVSKDIISDPQGNIYTTGWFNGTADFDPGTSTFQLGNFGTSTFISKLDSSGNFIWAKELSGTGNCIGYSLALGKSGNLYASGSFNGTIDFDPSTTSAQNNSSNGRQDLFIISLDSTASFRWINCIGGDWDEYALSITLDAYENVLATGYFNATVDFDPGVGTHYITTAASADAFVSKYDSLGAFQWAKNLGGSSNEQGNSVAVDDSGYVYTTGKFTFTVDFDPGSSTHNISSSAGTDIFISKLDSFGNFTWAHAFGDISNDYGQSIVVDKNYAVYFTGGFKLDVDFDPNQFSSHNLVSKTSNFDAYICKLVQCNNTSANIDVETCVSYISPSGKYTWNSSGIYNDTILNVGGCDSLLTIDLQIKSTSSSVLFRTSCDSLISPSRKYTWFKTGTYTDTILNSKGCDSTLIIGLIIDTSSYDSISVSSCSSYTSPSGKYNWTSSGNYQDTLPNAAGCDSILSIALSIGNPASLTLNETACDFFVSPSGNHTWTTSGTYYDTISFGGCDSTFIVNLTINKNTTSNISISACDSFNSPSGKYNWTTSGNYMDTIPNSSGCDSILSINLSILNNVSINSSPTACNSYTSPSGKYNWTTSGTYNDTIAAASGCDTIFNIQLTINKVDTSVSSNGSMSLTANALGAIYQWVDCNNNYAAINGKTHQSFTASGNGNYAVIVSQFNCTDTSSCYKLIKTGMANHNNKKDYIFYPNPTQDYLFIKTAENSMRSENIELRIYSISGKLLQQSVLLNELEKIDLRNLTNGIYYMQLVHDNLLINKKLIIAK